MESQQVDLTCDSDSIASSSAREKRWRRRLHKHREMTEEEMVQLALRLSEQEAEVYSVREEEGDVRKAIQQSREEQRPEPTESRRRDEPAGQQVSSGLESQRRACDADQDFPNGGSSDCSQESLTPTHRTLSPTFPRTPCSNGGPSEERVSHKERSSASDRPEVNPQEEHGCSSAEPLSSDMTLRWSDDEEDLTESRSPVFNHETGGSWTPPAENGPQSSASALASCVDLQQETPAPVVQYYWGVPFCPKSLSPDRYTRVIVSQLDVYSRSLKEAQRLLLRKAQWGDGLLPETNPPSPAEPSQQTDSGDDGNLCVDDAPEPSGAVDEDPQDMDCDTCPETQLSDGAEDQGSKGAAVQSPASPGCVPLGEDKEAPECTLQNRPQHEEEPEGEEKPDSSPSDVEEIQEVKGVRPGSPQTTINCPMCQLSFPLADVEMHAAYCEGDKRKSVDDCVQGSPARPRKRRRRRRSDGAADSLQEKCYICQKMLPSSSYSRHTQLCVTLSARPARGNLLSALEQSDSADIALRGSGVRPGPSGSRVQPCPSSSRIEPNDIIELQDDDEDEDLSRTFTDATSCHVTLRQKPKR